MSRSLLLGSMVCGLLLAGIAAVRGEFIMLALPIVIYLLAGYLFSPEDVKLEVTRHLGSERTSPDSDVTVTVTIANQGSHLEEVLVEDVVPAELKLRSAHSRHLIRLPKGGSYTFAYRVAGPRGGYGFESVRVNVNDHLSLTNREVHLDAKGQLFVFPPVMRLRHVAIRPRRTRVYAGTIPARVGGTGTEFYGVRLGWAVRRPQGKVLSVLRLVKGLFTFHGGMDYVLWKLERHTGTRFEVPDKVRRHPLVNGWGLTWRLYRQGLFR